jgi:hypothetical protein
MKIIDIPPALLQRLHTPEGHSQEWSDPQPLTVTLLPVPKLDRAMLPKVIAAYVFSAAHRMQAAVEFVLVPLLVALGTVIGSACGIRPKQRDTWIEVPNLWGIKVGSPSTLKSPTTNEGLKPLRLLAYLADKAHQEALHEHQLRQADRDMLLSLLKTDKGLRQLGLTPDQARQQIAEIMRAQRTDPEPQLKRYSTSDGTIEKIAEVLSLNSRGLLTERDEIYGFLKSFSKPGREGDRSFFLEGWSGVGTLTVDRISRGTQVIRPFCLSIHGTIQPDRLAEYLFASIHDGDNDGWLQRFQLAVFPDPLPDWKYVDEPPDPAVEDRINRVFKVLSEANPIDLGAKRDTEEEIPYFRFSTSAQKQFVDWLSANQKAAETIETPILVEHQMKYRKLVPALALMFHLIDVIENPSRRRSAGVSKETLQMAITLSEFLFAHAKRIYGMVLNGQHPAIQALAAKLKAGKLTDGFSERDIYKAGWGQLTDREAVAHACRELELDHWIRRLPTEGGPGRPASPCYEINPKLKS